MARKAFALAALFGCLSLAIGLTDYPDPAKGGMILLGEGICLADVFLLAGL